MILLPEQFSELVAEDVPDLFQIRNTAVAHVHHLRLGIKKALTGFLPRRLSVLYFAIVIIQYFQFAK
jgi:hypothetical protein